MKANAVRLPRYVVNEGGDANAVASQREVDGVLLDGSNSDDDHWRRVVSEPVLEGWTRQLPKPIPRENTILRQQLSRNMTRTMA